MLIKDSIIQLIQAYYVMPVNRTISLTNELRPATPPPPLHTNTNCQPLPQSHHTKANLTIYILMQ